MTRGRAVITGAGRAFCSGLDLKIFAAEDADRSSVSALIHRVGRTTKPLIGAINGPAVTGGFELALGCDFLIGSTHAMFADTHATDRRCVSRRRDDGPPRQGHRRPVSEGNDPCRRPTRCRCRSADGTADRDRRRLTHSSPERKNWRATWLRPTKTSSEVSGIFTTATQTARSLKHSPPSEQHINGGVTASPCNGQSDSTPGSSAITPSESTCPERLSAPDRTCSPVRAHSSPPADRHRCRRSIRRR